VPLTNHATIPEPFAAASVQALESTAAMMKKYLLLSCMQLPLQPKSLSLWERWAIHLYSNTPPHVEAPSDLKRGIGASSNYFILLC